MKRWGGVKDEEDGTMATKTKTYSYGIRFDAYCDGGTGLTADAQRTWLAEAKESVVGEILGRIASAGAVLVGGGRIVVQSEDAIDVEAALTAALGRKSAYATAKSYASPAQAMHGWDWDHLYLADEIGRADVDLGSPAPDWDSRSRLDRSSSIFDRCSDLGLVRAAFNRYLASPLGYRRLAD
jgi:hypothetical protein